MVSSLGSSGALGSLNSALPSLPILLVAPAKGQCTVAGSVNKYLCSKLVLCFGGVLMTDNALDLVTLGCNMIHIGIQIHVQIFLIANLLPRTVSYRFWLWLRALFARRISIRMPPSAQVSFEAWQFAPTICMRISELALPPNMERF